VIYLDTHVVLWIHAGELNKLSKTAVEQIQKEDLRISPVVIIELEFLLEIHRLKRTASTMVTTLAKDITGALCGNGRPAFYSVTAPGTSSTRSMARNSRICGWSDFSRSRTGPK
jgi:hypothetical protein